MGRAQIHKTPQARKEANKSSKRNARKAKEEAGFKPLNIDLDEITQERLNQLCIKLGYANPKEKHKGKGHIYSNVIGALIRNTVNLKPIESTASMAAQELYRLYSVVSHRDSKGDDHQKIASFMTKHGYPRPGVVTGKLRPDTPNEWTLEDVKKVIDPTRVQQKIEELDCPD